VVVEPVSHAEAVAKGRREEAGPGRRADERERRQIERERASGGALADDDVEPEVLERRVEDLLDRPAQAMDLVHEEDVALVERGQDRRQVALPLEGGSGDRPDPDAELLAQDEGEARLPEARWPDEQHVVERLPPSLCRLERDRELRLHPFLADELVQPPGAGRAL